jgi:hypothetical protein
VKPHYYIAIAAAVLLSLLPQIVHAQSVVSNATGCGNFGTAFNGMAQGMNALQSFFYGPFFKIGCLVALAVGGVVLLLDEGQLNGVAKFILRAVCVAAFVLGAASFLNIGSGAC